tara:strand:+ start:4184 stop:4342 length:159 start_codon:yes stop_codon:yes gene_type:complete
MTTNPKSNKSSTDYAEKFGLMTALSNLKVTDNKKDQHIIQWLEERIEYLTKK